MRKFRNATPEIYNRMADRLSELAEGGCRQVEFCATETAFGLRYNPDAVLWDKRIRKIAQIPDSIYYDWQHSLFGSGGVFQYQVNRFVIETLCSSTLKLPDLDKFAAAVRFRDLMGK